MHPICLTHSPIFLFSLWSNVWGRSVEWTYIFIQLNKCFCRINSWKRNCLLLHQVQLFFFLKSFVITLPTPFYFTILMGLLKIVLWVCAVSTVEAGLLSPTLGSSRGKAGTRQLVWSLGPLHKAVISRVTLESDWIVIKQFNRWKNLLFILHSHLFPPQCLALSYKYSITQRKVTK